MKSKISKILGIVLSLAMLSSLAVMVAPVAAAPGTNAWGEVTLPATTINGVDQLEIAPNGDMYVSSFRTSDGEPLTMSNYEWWDLYKSTDGGYTWTVTKLDYAKLGGSLGDDSDRITAIAASPDSQTIYVGTDDGDVWKIEDEGEAEPFLIQQPLGNETDEYASYVYDLEVWSDGVDNWVMAACDVDVLVLRDSLFELWRDMELNNSFGSFNEAYKASFAPDFETSFLLWALIDNDGDFVLTTTGANSPGQWGTVIEDCDWGDPEYSGLSTNHIVDFAFASNYTTAAPIIYAALTDWSGYTTGDGNLFLCEFAYVAATATTQYTPLLSDRGMCSVEVAGGVILAGAFRDNIVFRSINEGDTFDMVDKAPTGGGQVKVYMTEGFDAEDGVGFALTRRWAYDESAISKTIDGGQTWNQIAFIDTTIDEILDMTWSPDFPGGSFMLLLTYSDEADTISLWRTENALDAKPTWERVLCANDHSFSKVNFYLDEDDPTLVEWSQDGNTVMLFGDDDDESIYKSGDNAQTFAFWRTLPDGMDIQDWVVLDGVTFYAATDEGFYGKSAYGPPTHVNGTDLVSIALQPGFDASDPDDSTIIVGDDDGHIWVSTTAGDTWGLGTDIGAGYVYVAFDQMDPSVIYYATSGSTVGTATISGNKLSATSIEDFEDSLELTATAESFSGIWVAPGSLAEGGNALYALGGDMADSEATTDAYVWGMLEMDNGFSLSYASGSALCADGDVDLDGEYSGSNSDLGMSDFLLVPTSGFFTSGDDLDIDDYNVLEAITDTIVAGRVEVTGPDGEGYIDMVFTGLSGYDPDDDYVSVNEGSTVWTVDYDNDPSGAVMGAVVTVVDGEFATGDMPDVTAHTLMVDSIFPTIVSGTVAIQNPVVDRGTFDAMWNADFGFDNGDLGDTLDDLDSYAVEIVVVPDTETIIDAATDLFRILIGEVDNEWETEGKDGAMGLWGTKGSNIVWTVVNGDELWALHDTMATMVTGVTVSAITETTAKVSWAGLLGADNYEYKWWNGDLDRDFTGDDDTEASLSGLLDNTDYEVMVRVPAGFPFQSRWSAGVDFTTVEAIATPINQVPENGLQGAPILPSFGWKAVPNAVSYEFELGTAPDFAGAAKVTTSAVFLTWQTELAYDTNHYWRVRAVSATGTMSGWCASNFHTMLEPKDPIVIEPPPTPTINLPQPTVIVEVPDVTVVPPDLTVAPPDVTVNLPQPTVTTVAPVIEMPEEATPVFLWVIVAIGAILTIAVIVLIIRTRRVV